MNPQKQNGPETEQVRPNNQLIHKLDNIIMEKSDSDFLELIQHSKYWYPSVVILTPVMEKIVVDAEIWWCLTFNYWIRFGSIRGITRNRSRQAGTITPYYANWTSHFLQQHHQHTVSGYKSSEPTDKWREVLIATASRTIESRFFWVVPSV